MAKPRKPTPKLKNKISVSKIQKAFNGIEDRGIQN